jgi:hypothetical protein
MLTGYVYGHADFIPWHLGLDMKDMTKTWKWVLSAAKEGRLVSAAFGRLREPFYRLLLGQGYFRGRTLPCILARGDFSTLPTSVLLKQSFDQAVANIGGPPDFVRAIEGMSGQRYRTFINNLVRSFPDARYLEIGSWQGSTAAAALYGNSVKAVCIDNWSQVEGPKSAFLANMERVRSQSPAVDFCFIESDFRRVNYASLGRFNIFLFDGPHEELDQYDGIMVARPALEKTFILIVDDWNWRQVRLGTFRAIKDAKYTIASSIEIRTTNDNIGRSNGDWHNGYFIAVLVSA